MLGTREIGIAVMRLIDERLKRHGRAVRRKPSAARAARNERALAHAARDRFGELLAIRNALGVLGLRRIGQKTAFHQHGRNRCPPQNVKSAPTHTAIRSRRNPVHVIMDRGRERQTLRAIEVGFNSVRAPARCGIEMDANENRIAVLVGNGHAGSERKENITVAGHDDAIAVRLKDGTEPLRDVEIHRFLHHALPGNAAAIESAVTGVDDNSR